MGKQEVDVHSTKIDGKYGGPRHAVPDWQNRVSTLEVPQSGSGAPGTRFEIQ